MAELTYPYNRAKGTILVDGREMQAALHDVPCCFLMPGHRSTACAMEPGWKSVFATREELSKSYPTTLQVEEVSCEDCAWSLVHIVHTPTEIDWRPAETIAEDYYAL